MSAQQYQQLQNEYLRNQKAMTGPGNRGYELNNTRIESVDKTADNVYVNVIMDHSDPRYSPDVTGGSSQFTYMLNQQPEAAEYNVCKNEPIIAKLSDYYCTCLRFSIPLDSTPLYIMPIVSNQTALLGPGNENPNLTPFIIGINFNGVNYSTQIIYDNSLNAGLYPPPLQNQPIQVITPYYFVFTYQLFINMINQALLNSYTLSGMGVGSGFVAPYFFLDPVTNLISLISSNLFQSVISPHGTIYLNYALETYLDSFLMKFNGYAMPNGRDFDFILFDNTQPTFQNAYYPPGVAVPAPTNPPTSPAIPFYRINTQEYSTLEYWSSLRKIIITTNLPIRNEYLPATNNAPVFVNSSQSGVNVSYPILTDFEPQFRSVAGESRSVAYYVPTTQYRLVDLISDTSLQKLDLRIYWGDRDGNIYPLLISQFQEASIKLGFLKKSLYKENLNIMK